MINLFFVMHDHSGARTYARELLDYLSAQKEIKVHNVYLESNTYKEYTVVEDGNIQSIHIPKVKREGCSLEKYAKRCIDLIEQIVAEKTNLIYHLNYSTQVNFGVEARKRFGGEIVYTLHYLPNYFSCLALDNSLKESLTPTGDVLDMEIIKKADAIICVTQFAKKMIIDQYETQPEKISVIYNGFGTTSESILLTESRTGKLKEKLGLAPDRQIILFVGRLEFEKGVNQLINAFNRLIKEVPNLQLVLVGEGDYGKMLALCEGNWGKFTFAGKIKHTQIEELYQIADIGVIPSGFEQCSYVALEMMYHRLPIIVTEAPGLKELFQHHHNALLTVLLKREDGLLGFEVDENSLKNALKVLTESKELQERLGTNAKLKWSQNFTAQHMGQETLKLYKQLQKSSILTI